MTTTVTRLPNSEYLIKFLDGERTVMTWVLTFEQAESLWLGLDDEFTAEQLGLVPP